TVRHGLLGLRGRQIEKEATMSELPGKQSAVTLANGVVMPAVGLGTWTLRRERGAELIRAALDAGYRLIDSAAMYDNEDVVGQAVRASGLAREEVFITSKLDNSDHGYERALRAVDESLRRLGMEQMDLYLIHWPQPRKQEETWRAMEAIYAAGKARAIGVSNFDVRDLEAVLRSGEVKPAVNQIELHPRIYAREKPTIDLCQQEGIVVEAYSPLAKGRYLDDPLLREIAGRHGVSTAQVLIRWAVQHGFVAIPRSSKVERIRANLDVFGFELTDEDMARLDAMG